jgi:hypothetical protein
VVLFGRREVFGVSPLTPERPGLLLRKQKEAEPGLQDWEAGRGGGPGAGGSERDAPKGKREPKAKAKAKSRASPGLDAGHEEPEG